MSVCRAIDLAKGMFPSVAFQAILINRGGWVDFHLERPNGDKVVPILGIEPRLLGVTRDPRLDQLDDQARARIGGLVQRQRRSNGRIFSSSIVTAVADRLSLSQPGQLRRQPFQGRDVTGYWPRTTARTHCRPRFKAGGIGFVPADRITTKSLFVAVLQYRTRGHGGWMRSVVSLTESSRSGRGSDGDVLESYWADGKSTFLLRACALPVPPRGVDRVLDGQFQP